MTTPSVATNLVGRRVDVYVLKWLESEGALRYKYQARGGPADYRGDVVAVTSLDTDLVLWVEHAQDDGERVVEAVPLIPHNYKAQHAVVFLEPEPATPTDEEPRAQGNWEDKPWPYEVRVNGVTASLHNDKQAALKAYDVEYSKKRGIVSLVRVLQRSFE